VFGSGNIYSRGTIHSGLWGISQSKVDQVV